MNARTTLAWIGSGTDESQSLPAWQTAGRDEDLGPTRSWRSIYSKIRFASLSDTWLFCYFEFCLSLTILSFTDSVYFKFSIFTHAEYSNWQVLQQCELTTGPWPVVTG